MLKSALKKSCAVDGCGERHVTFSKTVQIYGNSVKQECVLDKFDNKLFGCEASDIELFSLASVLKNIEGEPFDCNLSDDPSDFLVHKVVYSEDELDLNDSTDDIKNSDLGNNDSDDEDFVVHRVVFAEDEVSDETIETDADDCSEQTKDEVVCELSVQNIEQHNKLTESQLLLECKIDSPAIFPLPKDAEIVLSPPLQELSVERLICPQADSWFWNLDISPLNSVQETDSDSNPSSDDTMILMTTEECMKNEQRIKESLQKFESLKKQTSVEQELKVESVCEEHVSILTKTVKSQDATSETNCSSAIQDTMDSTLVKRNVAASEIKDDQSSVVNQSYNIKNHSNESAASSDFTLNNESASEPVKGRSQSEPFVCYRESFWDKSLTAVEIPKDVREWKISLDKAKTIKTFGDEKKFCKIDSIHEMHSIESEVKGSSEKESEPNVDELEHFVDQCTERVERIRKRYSINENMLWTPRRGIRPRFGSSTEILQHMRYGNHLMWDECNNNNNNGNSHYSWPYYVSTDQQEKSELVNSQPSGFISKIFPGFQHKNWQELDSCELRRSSLNELGHLGEKNDDKGVCAHNRDELSSSSLPLLLCDERGTPEGASPPRLSSESLEDSEDATHSESIVYYSMQV